MMFEVHNMVSRYDVCYKKYMDLSSRLISGTKSEDIEPIKRTKRNESQKIK